MKELVVISGKGGTGKTSITAAFSSLAENSVFADCDVDASDLHLVLHPEVMEQDDFIGGKEAHIKADSCNFCGTCESLCRYDAINYIEGIYTISSLHCEGCGVCAHFCPEKAITLTEKKAGSWYISKTIYGPLVHAELGIAEDNSGKLVTQVREQAKKVAHDLKMDTIIIDGPPGVGCPVIASITGTDMALIVTEPTVSGLHDLKRITELVNHFNIETMVCINKSDLNKYMSHRIEEFCHEHNIEIAAQIPYDLQFIKAQLEGKSIVDSPSKKSSPIIKNMWNKINEKLLREKE